MTTGSLLPDETNRTRSHVANRVRNNAQILQYPIINLEFWFDSTQIYDITPWFFSSFSRVYKMTQRKYASLRSTSQHPTVTVSEGYWLKYLLRRPFYDILAEWHLMLKADPWTFSLWGYNKCWTIYEKSR